MANVPEDVTVAPGSKRRRLGGACDICRRRKVRCDSAQMPDNRCSNCIAFNSECTHASAPTKDRPAKTPANQNASNANKSAEAHVAAIVVQATAYIADADIRKVLLDVARYARDLENQVTSLKRSSSLGTRNGSPPCPPPTIIKEEEQDFLVNGILTERFDRFRLDSDADRYYGKSSHFELLHTAMEIKDICVEESTRPLPPVKRPLFWASPWEHEHLSWEPMLPPLVFPEPDLLHSLVALFFTKVNIVLGLLHRFTFERALADGLHLTNHQFGFTVLALCAVAAKHSDDPRVVLEGTNTRLSSGWKYFRQLRPLPKPWTRVCTLYEAQTLCLCVLYLHGSSAPDGCWEIAGAGLRYAQEVGVHLRNRFENKIEAEQWKRVFWVLICIDTLASSFSGRPSATRSSDYDLDYPTECDDEYWETGDPSMVFKQPPGKPSVMSFVTAYLKLMEILGRAQETIYLVNRKDKTKEWTKDAVANLDSALNAWIDVIPSHLRWDPHMEDPVFAAQSAVLYASYYHVQIQVHRIFIVGNASVLSLLPCPLFVSEYPSLAICASSARACTHVIDIALRKGLLCSPHILNAVFDSCIVLLLTVWAGRQVGLAVDPKKCLGDVEMCLRIFRAHESRCQIAGRQHDIITELMSATHMETPYTNPLKRGLDNTDSDPGPSSSDGSPEVLLHGIDEGPVTPQPFDADIFALGLDPLLSFELPMYTKDLGRLPVYEPLNWEGNWQDGIPLPNDTQGVAPGVEPPGSGTFSSNPTASLSLLGETPAGYDWGDWDKYITNVMHSFDNPTTSGDEGNLTEGNVRYDSFLEFLIAS
ncbi:fungal-specific transcription factor domain-containing protein [Mycena maculata]|uniref:Fungal-specific transcription factor domain-containing protein n=1 Tax=Mycena maculata TaxID=230809 RepID=A0AAD7HYP3_9AGAR|nr:fungal-specific transcription factor domain-containing protein [Mycena maculata]